jgi:amidase
MQELNDEKVLFAFARDLEPVLTVESGETVRIRTLDCFSNQLRTEDDKMDALDWDRVNPATGPIYVDGSKAGGTLKVDIENIEFDGIGVTATGKDEGVYGDRLDEWSISYLKVEDDKVIWKGGLEIPLRPMIGVIGVAPEGGPINCGTPGKHGGNMDNTRITIGSTLYLPVAVDGALFGCGDMHAVMGDGEIGVSGAEAPGYATVTLTAMNDLVVPNPLLETRTHFGVISSAGSLDEAANIAVHQMIDLVNDRTGVPVDELTMLFSLVGDVEVCQIVDPQVTTRFMVPRYVLDHLGFQL